MKELLSNLINQSYSFYRDPHGGGKALLDGWTQVPSFSNREMTVYTHLGGLESGGPEPFRVAIVWRGTQNVKDVLADLAIVQHLPNKMISRVNEAIRDSRRVVQNYSGVGGVEFIFSGHSLGGYLAWEAFLANGGLKNQNMFFVGFNPIVRQNFNSVPQNPRIKIYRTAFDPVSYRTPWGPNVEVQYSRTDNPHSLREFL